MTVNSNSHMTNNDMINKKPSGHKKNIIFIATLLVSATITAIFVMMMGSSDNATQMTLWKNNISFTKLNETVVFPKNDLNFELQQTASWTLVSGQYFAKICAQGNDNAKRVKSFTEIRNQDIPLNPTIVKIDVSFGCHNMQYNEQNHETIYQGKPVRFLVNSSFESDASKTVNPK
jgi:hypothetical protein